MYAFKKNYFSFTYPYDILRESMSIGPGIANIIKELREFLYLTYATHPLFIFRQYYSGPDFSAPQIRSWTGTNCTIQY